jgi:hypothetical protein
VTNGRWQRPLHIFATAVVIAAAAALWQSLPTPDDVYGPFDVHAGIGEQATGRGIETQVTGVRVSPRVEKGRYPRQIVDAVGTWVAIDNETMTTLTVEVPRVELVIGPNTYVPTMRVGVLYPAFPPGIRVRSSWVFDVPAELVALGSQTMSLRVWVGDSRLTSRLMIDIPLDDERVSREDPIVVKPHTMVGL